MRVLLVSYYFPPAGGGGVQRVLGWCRHLGEHGIEVTVAAPEAPKWVDEDTTLVIPADVRVVRTPDPSPAAVIPRDALARVRGVRRLARRIALQPRRFAVPDVHRRWRRPAVQAILDAARQLQRDGESGWDVVVSSSPPETGHLVALDVAARLGIPFVADFRDSWLDLPHLRLDRWSVRGKHARNVRLARRVASRASALTTVSEPLAADLRLRHPGLAVHVLENGVERDDVDRAIQRAAGFRDRGRFVIAYTGNFFGLQSPASFLDAVEDFAREHPDGAEELLVRFVGGLKPRDRARIAASAALSACVEHVDFLRHDDVLAQQVAADLLFLYVAPGRGSSGVYTGKVFEYVAAKRPVLAMVPEGNVAGALLDAAGSTARGGGARVEPDDSAAAAAALATAWEAWRSSGGADGGRTPDIAVPAPVLERIDRRTSTSQLAVVLREVSGNRPARS